MHANYANNSLQLLSQSPGVQVSGDSSNQIKCYVFVSYVH